MRSFWFVWILFLPWMLLAQNEDVLQQIKIQSQKINTIEADFIQTKNISFIDEQLISNGKFWFSRPEKMRWEYQKPFFYSIVINGEDITVIDDKKESHFDAASNAMFGQIKLVIMNMVNGKMFDDPNYSATLKKESGYWLVNFKTVNEAMKDYITSIDLYFAFDDYLMEKIRMNEASGDFTIIEFNNQHLNQQLTDDVFKP
jgi:outer membrane lipoprotein carrier protein